MRHTLGGWVRQRSGNAESQPYQSSLRPIWICRGAFDWLETRPKFLLLTAVFGLAKTGVSVKLENCPGLGGPEDSLKTKFRKTEKSQLVTAGRLVPGSRRPVGGRKRRICMLANPHTDPTHRSQSSPSSSHALELSTDPLSMGTLVHVPRCT